MKHEDIVPGGEYVTVQAQRVTVTAAARRAADGLRRWQVPVRHSSGTCRDVPAGSIWMTAAEHDAMCAQMMQAADDLRRHGRDEGLTEICLVVRRKSLGVWLTATCEGVHLICEQLSGRDLNLADVPVEVDGRVHDDELEAFLAEHCPSQVTLGTAVENPDGARLLLAPMAAVQVAGVLRPADGSSALGDLIG